MPERVVEEQEISLNGFAYPIPRPVQSALSSIYPPKIVIGDTSKDSGTGLSVLALSDHRGGIGLDVMEGAGETDRSWYSTADLRYKGHLILPPLVTTTSNLPTGANVFVGLVEFRGEIYVGIGASTSGIYKYDDSGDTWGSSLQALTTIGLGSKSVVGRVGATTYLIMADTVGYHYTTDGAAWSSSTTDARIVTIWDDKLWMMSTIGELWYSIAPGTDVSVRPFARSGNNPRLRDLFVGRIPRGEQSLYLAATNGLWVYDAGNDQFIPTGLRVPDIATATLALDGSGLMWREDIYFASGSGVYKYLVGPSGAVISVIGPDRDHGLPSGKGIKVTGFASSLNDLIVAMGGGASDAGIILAWNGLGWRVLYEDAGGENIETMVVAGAYGDYRLWFATEDSNDIKYIKLPSDIVNPLQISGYDYAAAATHEWPWFTAGQDDVDKLAVRIRAHVKGAASNETVIIDYALNYSSSYETALATITSNGITTFDLPNSATPTGTAFRSIRLRAKLARGGTTTLTPDLLSLTLEYRKKLPARWGHTFEVEIKDYNGQSAAEMRANLLAAIESTTLVEFTFRDDNGDTRNFYVDVVQATGLENTGHNESGTSRVQVVER